MGSSTPPRPTCSPHRVALAILCLTAIAVIAWLRHDAPTAAYLRTTTLESLIRNALELTDPRYSPDRLGKPRGQLDTVFDYDFERLEAIRRRLDGVDRRAVLAELFDRISHDCTTDHDRHVAVLEFCNKCGFYNAIQPMWPDRTPVFDPLICLELAEQRCGHSARVAASLLDAGGYETRIVQLGGHLIAEVFYDDDWHYLDATSFGGRWTVTDADGSIPSVHELGHRPFAIDAGPSYVEPNQPNTPIGSGIYPSYYYFSQRAYTVPAKTYRKLATAGEEAASRNYGWEFSRALRDESRPLYDFAPKHLPSTPGTPQLDGDRITWRASTDPDGDLMGYRVYVGSRSRGWCYGKGWRPEMYDGRLSLPPGDRAVLETAEASIDAPPTRPAYVTVMAFDRHGESVGRELYPMSPELALTD